MEQFTTQGFYDAVCSYTNSDNPFVFNTKANNNYIARYIDVFRRVKVELEGDDYNNYLKDGLLDKRHVIGICSIV
jgi:hypothetical protein